MPFVGRERELEEIRSAMTAVDGGSGRLLLQFGEAGAGKTRIAREASAIARDAGWKTLIGACPEGEGVPVFAPWTQILRGFVEAWSHESAIERALESSAAELARLFPGLRERFPGLDDPVTLEPGSERYRLFDAIGGFLRVVAARTPVLLVVDDLHAADRDSLQLLRFVARGLSGSRLLILATYRDAEVTSEHPFSPVLGDLLREPGVSQMPILGLSERDVGELIARTIGRAPDPSVVADVFRRTDGNAFFLTEVLRLLVAEGFPGRGGLPQGSAPRIPPGVREVLRRRLRVLSADARDVLAVAALLGREFLLGQLERMTDTPRRGLLTLLECAITAGMLREIPGSPHRFRISHALVRDTLYADLGTARRAELHQRAGEMIEESLPGSAGDGFAELSYHFQRSGSDNAPAKAYRYSVLAARHAVAQLAFEEATEHLKSAIVLLEADPRHDRAELCELWLELGDVTTSAGQPEVARDAYGRAGAIARQAGFTRSLGRAAIGMSGPVIRFGSIDHAAIELLEVALQKLPEAERDLRARALVRLAIETQATASVSRRAALVDESEALAKELGDVRTLSEVLGERRNRLRRIGHPEDRIAEVDDLIRRADEVGDVGVALDGRACRIQDLLELGSSTQLRDEMDGFADRAWRLRSPLYTHRAIAHQVIRATLEGRFAEAERHALTFFSVARQVSDWQAAAAFFGQMFVIRRLRGDLGPLLDPVRSFIEAHPELPVGRAGLATGLLDLGLVDEAAREYQRVLTGGLAAIPEDAFWFGSMALLAEVATRLGDLDCIARLDELLAPFATRNVVIGLGGCLGPTSRLLGLLSAARGRWDDAEQRFGDALRMAERLDAPPFRVVIAKDLGEMLVRRDAAGDRARAAALLEDAARHATRLGMSTALADIQRGLAQLADRTGRGGHAAGPAAAATEGPSVRAAGAPEPPAVLFKREGEYWSIGSPDAPFRLRDSIGLRCLAILILRPAHEQLAFDLANLASSGGDEPEGSARAVSLRSETILDQRAAAAYRSRLHELRDGLDDARARGDDFAAQRFQDEIDAVATELSRAIGLHGRTRNASSAVERARVNVTRTIREAIQRIAANDPALARHLRASVRTGTYCTYEPATARWIDWRLS